MKKLYSIVIAIVISVFSLYMFNEYIEKTIIENTDKFIYYNSDIRNSNDLIMDNIVTKESIVVLGSSELSSTDNLAYPSVLYNYGYSNFNLILIGKGYNQSLHHTISLGALQDNIKNNKVVLILSPQWFSGGHITSTIFSSRFIETDYIEFLKNKKISNSLKQKVAERVETLLTADPQTKERMDLYESIYVYKDNLNVFDYIELKTIDLFNEFRSKLNVYKEIKKLDNNIDYNNFVKAEEIDYKELLKEAKKIGDDSCGNNEFGIVDNYYDTYIKADLEELKDSSVNASYTISKEYSDLKLFFELCKELNIEPLIISVPVNGRWYDYTGFSKTNREEYYEKIRMACREYDVELADFSDKEYEKYFLKDIMHLGWKGWVYLDEAIYEFYKK